MADGNKEKTGGRSGKGDNGAASVFDIYSPGFLPPFDKIVREDLRPSSFYVSVSSGHYSPSDYAYRDLTETKEALKRKVKEFDFQSSKAEDKIKRYLGGEDISASQQGVKEALVFLPKRMCAYPERSPKNMG